MSRMFPSIPSTPLTATLRSRLSPRFSDQRYKDVDVLIIGSGPIGATYAKKLVEEGFSVTMIETGSQESRVSGEHKKNSLRYQKDVNSFIKVIQGDLETLSVPAQAGAFSNLNPTSYSIQSTSGAMNPEQDPTTCLDAKASRTVGGMSTHWTCSTPIPDESQLPPLYDNPTWDHLFHEAQGLLGTSTEEFSNSERQKTVISVLNEEYKKDSGRVAVPLPMACKRSKDNKAYVNWSSASTILGDLATSPESYTDSDEKMFNLLTEHHCVKLLVDVARGNITGAEVESLLDNKRQVIKATYYVVCAGAIHTPQILRNSQPRGPDVDDGTWPKALGKYLTEQPMTFCQVVLKKKLFQEVEAAMKIKSRNQASVEDSDPQVTIPFSKEAPWHSQIHRDAFAYGLVPEHYDPRSILDLRFYTYCEPNERNAVTFSSTIKDAYGMPQPTFHFTLSDGDKSRADLMMSDMIRAATTLGGFLPGSEPKFLPPGSSLHLCGTYRAGTREEYERDEAVVDEHCKVWGYDNLYLGGCGVIGSGIAGGPTLMAVAFAVEGAADLCKRLRLSVGWDEVRE
ncbi:pyranose oxidase [Ascobolus immersus RN42]|uniref:Pyranose oxidase n=1 Tax=Ascobolus immersus RN42 TaxID=1160509 RepID=A0A3N4HS46_ASCIM|nr:pyranose oxidase [Ascobolus immersus RN42]